MNESESASTTSPGSPPDDRRTRRMLQYAGIAVVAVAYLGGIAGWTYASMNVEPEAPESGAEETAVVHTTVQHDDLAGVARLSTV